jgi:hypothetical protein
MLDAFPLVPARRLGLCANTQPRVCFFVFFTYPNVCPSTLSGRTQVNSSTMCLVTPKPEDRDRLAYIRPISNGKWKEPTHNPYQRENGRICHCLANAVDKRERPELLPSSQEAVMEAIFSAVDNTTYWCRV